MDESRHPRYRDNEGSRFYRASRLSPEETWRVVALSAALWSLGLPAVEFAQDRDMTDHDDAIAPALFSPDRDIEPFARLLATRIEHARKPAT